MPFSLTNETTSLCRPTLQHRRAPEDRQGPHHPLRADLVQRLVQLSGRRAREEAMKAKKRVIHFDHENRKINFDIEVHFINKEC